MIGKLPIHMMTPPLVSHGSMRQGGVADVVDFLERDLHAPALVLAPAGLACVDTEDEAFEQAERLRTSARRGGAALVFGIDVGPPQPGSSRLFVCLGGAPVLWPVVIQRGFPPDAKRRVISIGGARLLPLFATEALDPTAARRIEQLGALGKIDLIAIISHGGATARWAAALNRLERIAPLVVAAHRGGVGRGYASAGANVVWPGMARDEDDRTIAA